MFGNPRLQSLLSTCADECPTLIQHLLEQLETFTGRGWKQEDDVTLVTLQRTGSQDSGSDSLPSILDEVGWHTLSHFFLPSQPGNERQAVRRVVEALLELELPLSRMERLKTAVAEAVMNAVEHGNQYRPELRVEVQVLASDDAIMIRITDQGSGQPIPEPEPPDLEAKIAEQQTPRGWGLFLIENMVDRVNTIWHEEHHTVELVLLRRGDVDDNEQT
jgi:anti-sigma regulatory factor (Ser/Thr protein kinase)